jgi:hypothetical protein
MVAASLRTSRLEMEDLWRERLEMARAEYDDAYANFVQVVRDQAQWPMPATEASAAIRKARLQQSRALKEYQRVLKIFTELDRRWENT